MASINHRCYICWMEAHSLQYLLCASGVCDMEGTREFLSSWDVACLQPGRHLRGMCCVRSSVVSGFPVRGKDLETPVEFGLGSPQMIDEFGCIRGRVPNSFYPQETSGEPVPSWFVRRVGFDGIQQLAISNWPRPQDQKRIAGNRINQFFSSSALMLTSPPPTRSVRSQGLYPFFLITTLWLPGSSCREEGELPMKAPSISMSAPSGFEVTESRAADEGAD